MTEWKAAGYYLPYGTPEEVGTLIIKTREACFLDVRVDNESLEKIKKAAIYLPSKRDETQLFRLRCQCGWTREEIERIGIALDMVSASLEVVLAGITMKGWEETIRRSVERRKALRAVWAFTTTRKE